MVIYLAFRFDMISVNNVYRKIRKFGTSHVGDETTEVLSMFHPPFHDSTSTPNGTTVCMSSRPTN